MGLLVLTLAAGLVLPAVARADDPEGAARDYVRRHLPGVDLGALGSPSRSSAGGVTTLRWRRSAGGIPAADAELRVNVGAGGRVLNAIDTLGRPAQVDTTPALSAGEAVRAVQAAAGAYRPLPRVGGPKGARQATTYADGTAARLSLYRDRLAWRVTYRASSREVYDAFVDADTGKVVRRDNLVKSALVWKFRPGAAVGGTAESVSLTPWLTESSRLFGPYVHAYSDVNDNDVADAGEDVAPGDYPLTTFTGTGCSGAAPCTWSGAGTTWQTNRAQNAVQAFYLANVFREHLAAAPISFALGDRLELQTDDGAALASPNLDNANMLTPPAGQSPIMQMYLWRAPTYRNANGGDDASILFHEYTHGLSNRLVVDADGAGALNSPQAGAMGEGWSDWYSLDFLAASLPGFEDPGVNGDARMGAYVDGTASIRHEAIDCPVGGPVGCSGYTYGDFGKIYGAGPEVHADGEIWAQTLWDLRRALGSAEAEKVVTAGLRITPPEPTYLDARNAILDADGGAHADAIWQVFAARGMGYYASTTGSEDVTPLEDFSLPPGPETPRGTLSGRVTDAGTGAPVAGAKAALGPLSAVTDADGRYTLSDVPAHGYASFALTAPGFDRALRSVDVTAGATTTADAALRRNWAARGGGASASGSNEYASLGCGSMAAIDQLQGSAWSTPASGSGKSMVIALPAVVDVDHFEVDPGEGCGDDWTSASRGLRIETAASASGPWTQAAAPVFGVNDRGRMNPVVPTAGTAGVRYVRVTILSTLGGAPYMDLSEFGVYTEGGPVATPTPTPTVTVSPSPSPVATPVVTVAPAPTPVPTATPSVRPVFTLSASGTRSVRVRVRCPRACKVTAALTVDAATARKLRLGKARTVGTSTARLKAGQTRSLTVRLNVKARRGFARAGVGKRFRATLKVKSGSVSAHRRVLIRR